jgi:purine-binding chemotaxis protein CheW
MNTTQYCTFTLDGLRFGVPVDAVQEVIRYLDMTTVPLADPVVHGLVNLRGQIVTALDLRTRLRLPARDDSQRPMNIIIRTDDGPISFLVDEIGEVVDLDSASFERPPDTVIGVARELIVGAHKLEGHLLLVLDVARALTLHSVDSAAA